MRILYYPGCSIHSSARAYGESTEVVCRALGITFEELEDWNCCGAKSAQLGAAGLFAGLPARNLIVAEQAGADLVTPCPACHQRLAATRAALVEAPERLIPGYRGTAKVTHLLKFLSDAEVAEQLAARVVTKLNHLNPVCYYGCLTVRPAHLTGYADFEDPHDMERLLGAVGIVARPWSYKTDCCGAGLNVPRPEVVRELVARLYDAALEAGANCIVTCCPLCQVNLDIRQQEVAGLTGKAIYLPVFFLTELLALALGHADAPRWWRTHLVHPSALLGGVAAGAGAAA